MGRDCRSSVLIIYGFYGFLVEVAGNVFLSDLLYALTAECVLGCGVKVALGAEVLG